MLTSVFHALAMRDVAAACDVLRPVWERTGGRDGYVSIEVDPNLAADTDGSIAQATHFHETIARPNLLVKIPATDAGVPAIEEMTARGYSINVTLIFSLDRHRQVAEAYLRGLERLIAADGDPARVHSVASFFVSRVDTETDRRLAARGRDDLRGRAGDRQRQARLPAIQGAVLWRALAGTRGTRCDRATLPVGVDLDQGSQLPRHPLCGRADRSRDDHDDARGDDRRLSRSRPRRTAGSRPSSRLRSRCSESCMPPASTTTTSSPRSSAKASRSSTLHSTTSSKASPTSAGDTRDGALSGRQGRGSSTASRVPAPRVEFDVERPIERMQLAPACPTSPNPPSRVRALEKPRPSSSIARTTDRSRHERR